eukprot:gene40561-50172_t
MGMGENLRCELVNLFGGHVHEICQFLAFLPVNLRANAVGEAVSTWVEAGGTYEEIREVLQEAAHTGFVPMELNSAMTRILTETNVCTTLTENALEFHLDPTLRRERSGLTPESQLMRLMIAFKLRALDEKYHPPNK